MPKSKGLKYFNKFHSWSKQTGVIRAEEAPAQEEFLVHPHRIPEEQTELALKLFWDWFLFDRKLTGYHLTPLELFIQEHSRKFKSNEADIYKSFLRSNEFGLYEVLDFQRGQWFDIRSQPKSEVRRIVDVAGSEGAEKGDFLVSRLIPFQDHWMMPSFVMRLASAGEEIHEHIERFKNGLLKESLRPRHILTLLIPKIDWTQEGLTKVKARLAFLLDQWGLDTTVSQIEAEIAKAHQESAKQPPRFLEILEKSPSEPDAKEATELLIAFWNLMIAQYRPGIDPREASKGPVEIRIIRGFTDEVRHDYSLKNEAGVEKFNTEIQERFRRWIKMPSHRLAGKTPEEAILEERKSLGNPRKEVAYEIKATEIKPDPRSKQGPVLADRARQYLMEGKPHEAIDLYLKACPFLKGDFELFRVYGNLATAYVQIGEREKALEAIRASLKINPDYEVARNNLHLIESMSEKEFRSKFKSGFFQRTETVSEDED